MGLACNRGTRAPRVGDKRSYRSQVGRGKPYLKVPLNTLGITEKGVRTHVSFEDGRIVIEASAETSKANGEPKDEAAPKGRGLAEREHELEL